MWLISQSYRSRFPLIYPALIATALVIIPREGRSDDEFLDEEFTDMEGSSEGIFQIRDAYGVPTEAPFWMAYFATHENIMVSLPSNRDQKRFGLLLFNCSKLHTYLGPRIAQLSDGDQSALLRLFSLLIYLHDLSSRKSVPILADGHLSCDERALAHFSEQSPGTLESKLVGYHWYSASLVRSPFVDQTFGEYKEALVSRLTQWRGRGIALDDLLFVYLIERFPNVFILNESDGAKYPAEGTARDIFWQKTTPSVELNNSAAGAIAEHIPWKKLGMSSSWILGIPSPSRWLARFHYNHPVLTSMIPIYGTLWDTLDSAISLYEGRNSAGEQEDRVFSAALLVINFSFFAMDLVTFGNAPSASINSIRKLMQKASRATNSAELAVIAKQVKQVIQNGEIGLAAARVATTLGTPVRPWHSLVMRALGHTIESSEKYIKIMYPAVRQAAAKMKNAAKFGIPLNYKKVQEFIEKASRRANVASGNPNSGLFGKVREMGIPYITPFGNSGKYGTQVAALEEFAKKGRLELFKGFRIDPKARPAWINTNSIILEGEEILMTRVAFYVEPSILLEGEQLLRGFVLHSQLTPKQIEKIERRIGELFSEVRDIATPQEDAIRKISEIHWLEANFTRHERGSSGIADAMARAMLRFRGVRAGMYRADVLPDFEAFVRPIDDFVQMYHTFFERTGPEVPQIEPVRSSFPVSAPRPEPMRPIQGAALGTRMSGSLMLHGWAIDSTEYMGDDIQRTIPGMEGTQFNILVERISPNGEREYLAQFRTDKKPTEDVLMKHPHHTQHAFRYLVPPDQDKNGAKFKVYAQNPFDYSQTKLLGEFPHEGCLEPVTLKFELPAMGEASPKTPILPKTNFELPIVAKDCAYNDTMYFDKSLTCDYNPRWSKYVPSPENYEVVISWQEFRRLGITYSPKNILLSAVTGVRDVEFSPETNGAGSFSCVIPPFLASIYKNVESVYVYNSGSISLENGPVKVVMKGEQDGTPDFELMVIPP